MAELTNTANAAARPVPAMPWQTFKTACGRRSRPAGYLRTCDGLRVRLGAFCSSAGLQAMRCAA